jgi:nucleotide-binding universal stress UspA family protein
VIVIGTHGRHGLAHLLLGSVAERVLRDATCPVLTTHAAPQGQAA